MIPQGYYDYTIRRESGGNANARNQRSSATGPAQFIDSTWNELMRKYPQLGLTTDGRTDEDQSMRALKVFTQENADFLKSKGYDTNRTNLYLAHRFGPQGALKLLTADPKAPVHSVVSPDVMEANPDLNGKTVGNLTGTQMAPRQNEVVPAQRMVPGVMPALSTQAMLGPGALQSQEEPSWTQAAQTIGDSMQGAGAWLMAISDPRALGALDKLGPKAGRYQTTYDASTGRVVTVDTQSGRVVTTQDPNFDPGAAAKKVYEETRLREKAKNDVELPTKFAKAQDNLTNLGRQWDLVDTDIDNALKAVDAGWATGLGGLAASIPGTNAHKLAGLLNTIKANVGFDKLQAMRDASPTGGALGQVSDFENKLLQAIQGTLDQTQDADTLKANLGRIRQNLKELRADRQAALQRDFGALMPQQPAGPAAPVAAPAAPAAPTIRKYNPATGKIE